MSSRPARSAFLAGLAVLVLVASSTVASGGIPASSSPRDEADGYRFNVSIYLEVDGQSRFQVRTSGVFVAPSAERCTMKALVDGSSVQERRIAVGDRVWLDTGGGYQLDAEGELQFGNLCASDPEFWKGFVPPRDVSTAISRSDDVIGRERPSAGAPLKVVVAERLEFAHLDDVFPALGERIGIPPEATVDQLFVQLSKTSKPLLVGIDLRVSAANPDVCNDFLGAGEELGTTGACALMIDVSIFRLDDPRNVVKPPKVSGSGSS